MRKNNKFFRQIFENVKTSDNLMFIKKDVTRNKIEETLYELYSKNKDILNIKRNNVIVTPHIAGVTKEAVERMDIEVANNIVKGL